MTGQPAHGAAKAPRKSLRYTYEVATVLRVRARSIGALRTFLTDLPKGTSWKSSVCSEMAKSALVAISEHILEIQRLFRDGHQRALGCAAHAEPHSVAARRADLQRLT